MADKPIDLVTLTLRPEGPGPGISAKTNSHAGEINRKKGSNPSNASNAREGVMNDLFPSAIVRAADDLAALAVQINAEHRACEENLKAGLEHALEAGRLLLQAKATIGHGGFLDWLSTHCRFSTRTAQAYMRIAQKLPTLDLPNAQRVADLSFREALARLSAAPTARPEVVEPETGHACSVADLGDLVATGQAFGTIYADPPWRYSNKATRAAAEGHYPTMSLEEIAALPVAQLAAEQSHLHLWTTNAFLFECQEIMKAWGFEYKSMLIWVKPNIGMGNYWRVSHEILLLGVRNGCKFLDKGQASWLSAKRGRHSAKPAKVRRLIERVSPGPRLELFARTEADGWAVWGNQIERTIFDEVTA
jgi:N6-adenosine-specific RNA methylase IME4